jgi:hypothetical protein
LAALEEIVTDHAAGRAALAGQFTTVGERHIMVYTNDPGWAKDLTVVLGARVTEDQVRVSASSDPQWKLYRLFGKLRRYMRTSDLAMTPLPLLAGAFLVHKLGVGWGLGDAVVMTSVLAVLIGRSLASRPSQSAFQIYRQSDWLDRHPGWGLALNSLLMATYCFVFTALLSHVLTVWACAAIALVLGVAVALASDRRSGRR